MIEGVNGIDHVALSVPDLDRALEFYCGTLGMELVERFEWQAGDDTADELTGLKDSAAQVAIIRAGNACVELFQFSSPVPTEQAERRPVSDHGFTHLSLDVTAIDEVYARLLASGVEFHSPPRGNLETDGYRITYGCDPFGNVIELQELAPPSD